LPGRSLSSETGGDGDVEVAGPVAVEGEDGSVGEVEVESAGVWGLLDGVDGGEGEGLEVVADAEEEAVVGEMEESIEHCLSY
jgi:hypothetical protein